MVTLVGSSFCSSWGRAHSCLGREGRGKGMSRDPPQRATEDTFLSPLMPNSCSCFGRQHHFDRQKILFAFVQNRNLHDVTVSVLAAGFTSFLFFLSCRIFLEDYATLTYRHEVMEKLPCVNYVSCRPR